MNLRNSRNRTFINRREKALVYYFWVFCWYYLSIFQENQLYHYTSTDKYCTSCHIHPMADQSWKLSTHYNNPSGNIVHCAECHLPPEGQGYLFAKAKHGLKDIYGYLFKDSAEINWEEKKLLENAKKFVYEKSCLECHQNLFPVTSVGKRRQCPSFLYNKQRPFKLYKLPS